MRLSPQSHFFESPQPPATFSSSSFSSFSNLLVSIMVGFPSYLFGIADMRGAHSSLRFRLHDIVRSKRIAGHSLSFRVRSISRSTERMGICGYESVLGCDGRVGFPHTVAGGEGFGHGGLKPAAR